MTTKATNATIAPSAASTPQTMDHSDGSRLAIVSATAVVAHAIHARRGRTGGGIPPAGGSTPTSGLGAAHRARLPRHAPRPRRELARRGHPIVELHRGLSLDGVDRAPSPGDRGGPRGRSGRGVVAAPAGYTRRR